MMEKIKENKFAVFTALSVWSVATGSVILGFDIDQEHIKLFFGEVASNQIAQAGFFFMMASWIHSGRVKKEIKINFASLTSAINNVADSFREDLKKHSERLDNLSNRVLGLEKNTKANDDERETLPGAENTLPKGT